MASLDVSSSSEALEVEEELQINTFGASWAN
jgi:hypothetical protein